jgi:hypothetical protein
LGEERRRGKREGKEKEERAVLVKFGPLDGEVH